MAPVFAKRTDAISENLVIGIADSGRLLLLCAIKNKPPYRDRINKKDNTKELSPPRAGSPYRTNKEGQHHGHMPQ
jgi:hypothetical protein